MRRSTRAPPAILWIGGAVVVAWLALALALLLARDGFWETTTATPQLLPPPRIAYGIVVPTILGSLLVISATFRDWIRHIPLHLLVGVQFYRTSGVMFLIAYAMTDMPAAVRAAGGDR